MAERIGEREERGKHRLTKQHLRIPSRKTGTKWAFALPLYKQACTPYGTGGGGDRERRGKATRKSIQALNKILLPFLFPNGAPRAGDRLCALFHLIRVISLFSHVVI